MVAGGGHRPGAGDEDNALQPAAFGKKKKSRSNQRQSESKTNKSEKKAALR